MTSQFVQHCLDLFDVATSAEPQAERIAARRDLCELVAANLEQGRHSAIRHPKGLDNGLSYVIPALLHRDPVVITTASTDTMNEYAALAESLADLPDSELARPQPSLRGKTVFLLMPRETYLCRLLVKSNLRRIKRSIPLQSRADFLNWAKTTETGFRADAPFGVTDDTWHKAALSDEQCQSVRCDFWKTCHTQLVRQAGKSADVVLTTHALYCSDGLDPILRAIAPHEHVIVDSAEALVTQLGVLDAEPRRPSSLLEDVPSPNNELQDLLLETLSYSRTHLLPIIGESEFADLDPLAIRRLDHSPDFDDWLRHAKERLHHLLLDHLVPEQDRLQITSPTSLTTSWRHELTELISFVMSLRHRTDPRVNYQLPALYGLEINLADQFGGGEFNVTAIEQQFDERASALTDELRASWGEGLCSVLDPESNTTKVLWERGHFWLQHAAGFLRKNIGRPHPGLRDDCLGALGYMLLTHRLDMLEDITRNLYITPAPSPLPHLALIAPDSQVSISDGGGPARDAELRIQSALIDMQTALEESKPSAPLGSPDSGSTPRDNFLGIYGARVEWRIWSTARRIAQLEALDHGMAPLSAVVIDQRHRELLVTVRTLLSLLELMSLSLAHLSSPENKSLYPATHFATVTEGKSEPILAFTRMDQSDHAHRLRRQFRNNLTDCYDDPYIAPTRPVFVSSQLSPEMATALGAYDNALPYQVT